MSELESLSAVHLANYPLECRAAFLAATRKSHVARKTDIDEILDRYNLWLSVYDDSPEAVTPLDKSSA